MTVTRDLHRRIEDVEPLFAFLGAELERHGVDERSAFCVNLAAEELFTNMVRHNEGDSDRISLALDITPERIRFELVDYDVEPFDPATAPDAGVDRPIEERTAGGLGLHLVKSVVDKVTWEYENRKMKVTVLKQRGG